MKNRTKLASAIVCVILLTMTLLGGCTSPATSKAPDATTQPAASGPFGNGTEIRFACLEGWYPSVTMADNLEIWQEFEKRTGVKIKWEVYSDYDTAMQPRVASGEDLPDIMLIPPAWGNSGVFKLATDGLIIPLDDLIAKNAPDIQALFGAYPDVKALLTAPDGKVYTVADMPKFVNDVVASSFFIRQDWLDKLGMKAPTTTDEWHTVLKAFKETDLNGNGQADEIAFSGDYSQLSYFGPAFGLTCPTTAWWYDKDGKVYCQYATDQYKELLTFLNGLYSEGLLDKELTRDEANFQSLASKNVVGSFMTLCGYLTLYDNLLKGAGVADANHQCIVPPTGANGVQILKRDPVWSHYGITRDCKTPEIAIKWINYVWGSDEGVRLNEFGIEGKTYTMGTDGKPHYTDFVLKNPDGLDPYNALRSLGASNTVLVRTPMDVYTELQKGSKSLPFEESIVKNRVEPFPSVMATEAEQSVLDVSGPDFESYVQEMQIKFLTGAEPLSNYDEYISTLSRLGIEKLQAVYQSKYDRAKGIK